MYKKYILIILIAAHMLPAYANGQERKNRKADTVKDKMEILHEAFGVNFVYEPSAGVGQKYRGGKIEGLPLEKALEKLFLNTGIVWEKDGNYIILKKKKPEPLHYNVNMESGEVEVSDTIAEARITSMVGRQENSTQTGLTRLDASKFKNGYAFLSSPDIIKTLQSLPGVSSGTELMSGMYVHGGTGSDNLYLLDGVPLYQISHLAGLFSSFNADIVEDVYFYKSGFPARYGSMLSSVVDVNTRDGDFNRYHGSFSLGLMDGRIQFGGPIVKDKTSFNISVRRSWMDVVTIPMMAIVNSRDKSKKQDYRYAFGDLNARLTHKFDSNNSLIFNAYTSNDVLKLLTNSSLEVNGEKTENTTYRTKLRWGNLTSSLAWKSRINDKMNSSMSVYYGQYISKMDLDTHSDIKNGETINKTDENNISRIRYTGIKTDFDWKPVRSQHFRFGAGYQFHMFSPERKSTGTLSERGKEDVISRYDVTKFYTGHEPYIYLEDEISFNRWFKANLGARYALFAVEGKVWHGIEPRAALKFQCGEPVSIKISYSDMNQFSHQIATTYLDLPTACWMPSTKEIRPMHSRQIAGGVYANLPYNFRLNVEGFWKTMDHIREYSGKNTLYPPLDLWETSFKEGKGRSYGAEFEIGYKTAKTDIAVYYTLSWSERYFEQFWRTWYPDRYDNRHKVTVMASHKFNEHFDVYLAWNYHTGNRITVPEHEVGFEYGDRIPSENFSGMYLYGRPNNMKIPDYHRLDMGFNWRKSTRKGNERIWNFSIYNVYCRMNPLLVSTDSSENGSEAKAIGIIPIIPSISYTLNF